MIPTVKLVLNSHPQGMAWGLHYALTPVSDQDIISPYNINTISIQYQYNIKQTSGENKVKYQLGDYKLIQYQILQTNITKTVCQTVRRITK